MKCKIVKECDCRDCLVEKYYKQFEEISTIAYEDDNIEDWEQWEEDKIKELKNEYLSSHGIDIDLIEQSKLEKETSELEEKRKQNAEDWATGKAKFTPMKED